MEETNESKPPQAKSPSEIFGDLISQYTRRQAIEDGVLVDVSEMAREAGFKYPFAMTAEVWSLIQNIPERYSYEDVRGRLWDVLMMARHAIAKATPGADEILFDLILHQADSNRLRLKIHCGPDDNGEAVLTVMFQHQD